MADRRVTLVMTEHERDEVATAISAALTVLDPQMERCRQVLERQRDRLRAARVGSWGKRR